MQVGISTSVIQRGRGGVGQYVLALTRALLARGVGARLTLFVLEEDLDLFDFAKAEAEIVLVPERYRPAVRNVLWHQVELPALARRHRLDVLHVPSYRRMLWRRPCPLVATIHDLAPFRISRKYDWKRMFYGQVVARRLAARQDKIIAVSQNTAVDLRNFFGLAPEQITVIHNGIDHARFFPADPSSARRSVSERYGVSAKYFLYVARLEHPGKNHIRLVTAFEEFKAATKSGWQLVLAGSDWSGAEAIHERISRSPCQRDIRCLGFVPDSQIPDLYRAAEVFVYPSLYEGFGMPPVEAMACGCPVISSSRGALGEVLGDSAAVVDPEEVHSMAKQL